jgi:hypothetical protein
MSTDDLSLDKLISSILQRQGNKGKRYEIE